jgi:hypothetical protein
LGLFWAEAENEIRTKLAKRVLKRMVNRDMERTRPPCHCYPSRAAGVKRVIGSLVFQSFR